VDGSGPAYKERDRVPPVFILFLALARKRDEENNNGRASALSE
jgi:hypothetical protein